MTSVSWLAALNICKLSLMPWSDIVPRYTWRSVAKIKVMVVSRCLTRSPGPEAVVFTCNGLVVEQVDTFKHLGLHFHSSRGVSHLVTPLKAKAAAALGLWCSKGILNCSVATQSTSNFSYCKASLYPLCITAVNCGACIPPVARRRKHELLYSLSMTDT